MNTKLPITYFYEFKSSEFWDSFAGLEYLESQKNSKALAFEFRCDDECWTEKMNTLRREQQKSRIRHILSTSGEKGDGGEEGDGGDGGDGGRTERSDRAKKTRKTKVAAKIPTPPFPG